jgi:hypothetical protein
VPGMMLLLQQQVEQRQQILNLRQMLTFNV